MHATARTCRRIRRVTISRVFQGWTAQTTVARFLMPQAARLALRTGFCQETRRHARRRFAGESCYRVLAKVYLGSRLGSGGLPLRICRLSVTEKTLGTDFARISATFLSP